MVESSKKCISRVLKIGGIAGCVLFGIVVTGFLNYYIIEPLLIPDPCAYHGEETSILFSMAYQISSSDGFHPAPTLFNRILTLISGVITGYLLYKYCKSNWLQ